jgi:hypothetical protein
MNSEKINSVVSRLFFAGSFLMLATAVFEKLANLSGYTIVRGTYEPSRLLELAAILLLFVIAMLLRQVREALRRG